MNSRALSLPAQRGVTIDVAASYVGLSVDAYKKHQRAGRLPGPWPGTQRYDLKAIDRSLDRWSGLDIDREATEDLSEDDWLDAFDESLDPAH